MSDILIPDTEELTVIDDSRSPDSQAKPSNPKGFMLTVVQGSNLDFGKIFNFSCENIRIGRDRDNTIQLDDRKVSKQHCEIKSILTDEIEQFFIKDLDSTNGTYVNGEFVRQRMLATGDKILIGETVLRFNYNDEIEEEYHARLFSYAAIDSLTGLYNRRYILNELENQYKIARRNKRIFSIVLIDIDDFKQINDTYGHPAGDEYLKHIAFNINHTLREQDICGRLGGEEFMVILPETDIEGAFQLGNRIRIRIENNQLDLQGNKLKATVSAGVSQYEIEDSRCTEFKETEITPGHEQMLKRADVALYDAKRTGKNKVIKSPLRCI